MTKCQGSGPDFEQGPNGSKEVEEGSPQESLQGQIGEDICVPILQSRVGHRMQAVI